MQPIFDQKYLEKIQKAKKTKPKNLALLHTSFYFPNIYIV